MAPKVCTYGLVFIAVQSRSAPRAASVCSTWTLGRSLRTSPAVYSRLMPFQRGLVFHSFSSAAACFFTSFASVRAMSGFLALVQMFVRCEREKFGEGRVQHQVIENFRSRVPLKV